MPNSCRISMSQQHVGSQYCVGKSMLFVNKIHLKCLEGKEGEQAGD